MRYLSMVRLRRRYRGCPLRVPWCRTWIFHEFVASCCLHGGGHVVQCYLHEKVERGEGPGFIYVKKVDLQSRHNTPPHYCPKA
jgi:hypothetical protein